MKRVFKCALVALCTSIAPYLAAQTESRHYGCGDFFPGDTSALSGTLTFSGMTADAINIREINAAADRATIAVQHTTNSQQELRVHGARIEGADLHLSLTYPLGSALRPGGGGGSTFANELTFPKPPAGDYRVNVQIPYGCAIGTTRNFYTGTTQVILRVRGERPTVIVSMLTYLPMSRNFMTASLDEAQFLRATPGVGASFALLDDNFRAWPTVGDAPPGVAPVCRFFRASTITHAYSADAAECAAMRANPLWSDEGIAFRALVPTAGVCASGTEPIYKLTNATLGDTQRYTRSEMTYRTLQLNGWTARGVAFCSPVG